MILSNFVSDLTLQSQFNNTLDLMRRGKIFYLSDSVFFSIINQKLSCEFEVMKLNLPKLQHRFAFHISFIFSGT